MSDNDRSPMLHAGDVMTHDVATIAPDTPLADAVRTMLDRHISGLPVVDGDGRLAGMLTEGDLLRRSELGTEALRPRWLEFLLGPARQAEAYVVAHGRKVGELMTAPAVSVDAATPLEEVVAIMQRHRIKRLPVLRDGLLVGIVSRADLLRALSLRLPSPVRGGADAALREQVLQEMRRQSWLMRAGISVVVQDGVIDLEGTIFDEHERAAIRVIAENVPGVRTVRDHLVWVEPNTGFVYDPDAAAPATLPV